MSGGLVFRNGIRRQLTRRLLFVFCLLLAGTVLVAATTLFSLMRYERTSQSLREKQKLVEDIRYHAGEIILRSRGYYVLLNDYEYNRIFTEKEALEADLSSFNKMAVTKAEKDWTASIESFYDHFFNDLLPAASTYAQQGNYDALRKLTVQGENSPANTIMKLADQFRAQINEAADDQDRQLFSIMTMLGLIYLAFIGGTLGISILVGRTLAKEIGSPLEQLAAQAERYRRGEEVHIRVPDKDDEIRHLAKSFEALMIQIQANEEELTAQNDELHAQQEELQAQQEELTEALRRMEENEVLLQKRNLFIQSLVDPQNREELLASVIRNTVEIARFDKGLIVMMPGLQYAAFGVSERAALTLLENLDDSPVKRIAESGEPYIQHREGLSGEFGIHDAKLAVTDAYVPVHNTDGELCAVLILSRTGRAVGSAEINELTSFARQISLSLAKLDMLEAIRSQRRLIRNILNTVQESIHVTSPTGEVTFINRNMRNLVGGLAAAEQMHLTAADLFRQLDGKVKDSDKLKRFYEDALQLPEGRSSSFIYEIGQPERIIIQVYAQQLFNGQELSGTLFVHRDMTREREVDEMKSEFVSTVSHELRTPLASVLGFAELMLHRELTPERQRKYISTIYQEAARLTDLINDFLDLQRMESGKQSYDMKAIEIAPLLEEVADLHRAAAPQCSIVLQLQEQPLTVKGDRDKLKQMLMNLIGNAVKYSPDGGRIDISCLSEQDEIRIDIADQGLGIPEEALPHLFTKFFRVDNSDRREIGGTGLGLAIVKEIVEKHEGRIEVRSTLGEGSVFTVHLPAAPPAVNRSLPDKNAAEGAWSSGGSRPTIMLIENDLALSDMLGDELQESGFDVRHFSAGNEALEAMKEIVPDAVIVDLMLEPGMDGWKVIEWMQHVPKLQHVPVLISSALEEKERAMQAGVRHFLVKPYQPGKLIDSLRSLVTTS
ncbi:ATP-binding protein [Paenibacillus beijingensis]|uniref:histidine kinase n=1 Tax=Paenibacillus beijingensis TaxID=1126833 RepID=A0A0D5NN20_9BACL|nr:ATP-binding protein [Paenibacillus beijingensis]AJY76694.1 hypothetical protein VN24_21615 [Paenibacillus beijingensis]